MEGRLPRGFCVKRLTDLPMLGPSNGAPSGFVRAMAGRLRWAQHAQTRAGIRPRVNRSRPALRVETVEGQARNASRR